MFNLIRRLSIVMFVLAVPVFVTALKAVGDEGRNVLDLCERYFGPAVDSDANLYEANSWYVLHVTFDGQNKVEKLEVVPKYYFAADHPEWEQSDSFEYLSWTQYQNLFTRVSLIKPV